ncbi:MAG: peptide chain release factor 2 [Candidatus Schekmanbacteria bacterium RBG_13_48_7]|uniref:Peptide chain release factor 2 n=1 Tax=Candidatus Schekmanbacteria bacterium RBG_13_48_7 TaxID=1817878 RepID=A0A1F7RK39_9BACT|nr:MAG: peptide chain release factor 2 [Candidatus Schekmanbacteria bacterium RBG_13_48_7]
MAAPDFWDSSEKEKKKDLLKERTLLIDELATWRKLKSQSEDLGVMLELANEEDQEGGDAVRELEKLVRTFQKEIKKSRIEILLSGQYDSCGAILSIHSGAGGTESQDWAEMLLRMYTRWMELRKYDHRIVDLLPGEEAGIKSATVIVNAAYAYGYLRAEIGVHRLVRLSPFDANHRRHTSFASVFVFPDIEDEIDIQIDEKELRIDTFRSSGAGGQHVNVTDSAVRITHIPSGIVVQCQNERSQHRNKSTAMKILKSRLYEKQLEEQEEKMEKVRGQKKDIAWGSQIRSYILHPYRLIKDHRTGIEIGDTDRILNGDLDPFIEAFLIGKKTTNGD